MEVGMSNLIYELIIYSEADRVGLIPHELYLDMLKKILTAITISHQEELRRKTDE